MNKDRARSGLVVFCFPFVGVYKLAFVRWIRGGEGRTHANAPVVQSNARGETIMTSSAWCVSTSVSDGTSDRTNQFNPSASTNYLVSTSILFSRISGKSTEFNYKIMLHNNDVYMQDGQVLLRFEAASFKTRSMCFITS